MGTVAKQLIASLHTATNKLDVSFQHYGAGAAALGHSLGRFVVLTQHAYDQHRLDCKHCANKPLDFRAIFLANFNDAAKEERNEIEADLIAGEHAAASFLERIIASHDPAKTKDEYKDPKTK